jgi:hypothetical protein
MCGACENPIAAVRDFSAPRTARHLDCGGSVRPRSRGSRVRYRDDAMFDALDNTVVALIIGLVAGLVVGWFRSVVAGLVAFAVATGLSKLLLPALVGF